MKKHLLATALLSAPFIMSAQSAVDGYQLCQPDLKGTARFMSMGGAFGALGGDLSTLSQNPGGIGIYRKNEFGITVDLVCQSSKSQAQGLSFTDNQTKFLLNNVGAVFTYNYDNDLLRNFNFGFTYNRAASFARRYKGMVPRLSNSLSNYVAGITNNDQATVADLSFTNSFNPYNPNDGGFAASWLSILGYSSYLITPEGDADSPYWVGQWQNATSGSGSFTVEELGGIDEYNIALGGNFADIVYWGMNFGIIDINYQANTIWGETLENALVDGSNTPADWNLQNYYQANGNGFNYKIGLIVKPIQELRVGLAVHTPTWYNLTDTYQGAVSYRYNGLLNSSTHQPVNGTAYTNDGYVGSFDYNFRSPWSLIASVAGVIGSKFIISADYQWSSYANMHYSEANDYYWDDWYYRPGPVKEPTRAGLSTLDPYYYTNNDIQDIYQGSSTVRVGAEYRVTPSFSVRAGFNYTTSPVKQDVRDNETTIYTAGTTPQYSFDNDIYNLTCGLGYRYKSFYIDGAYVFKHRSSTYHAYTPDPGSGIPSPEASITDSNSQVVVSMGFKF